MFFPFQLLDFFPWNPKVTLWFQKLCSYLNTEGYIHYVNNVTLGLFYFLVFVVGFIIALAIFVAYSFSNNKITAIWPLRVLRSVTSTLVTIFFLPGTLRPDAVKSLQFTFCRSWIGPLRHSNFCLADLFSQFSPSL